MKYLVTGGAGFIGSHIVEELLIGNNDVVILDDYSTGRTSNVSFENTYDGTLESNKGSVEDLTCIKKVSEGCDGIFHQAALVSVPGSITQPLKNHNINSTGTLNVLIAAREEGIKKIVLASSSAVYGDNTEIPLVESHLPRPLSPYAVSKLTGEYYSKVFSELYDMRISCLRYFNVYGPRQDPASEYAAVIPRFVMSCLNHNPVTIYGDGSQSRDFIYIKDVVQANLSAMKYGTLGVFNIARGEKITINELLYIIQDLTGISVPVDYQPTREGDIHSSLAGIHLAETQLHFKPEFDIKNGLRATIEWFKRFKKVN